MSHARIDDDECTERVPLPFLDEKERTERVPLPSLDDPVAEPRTEDLGRAPGTIEDGTQVLRRSSDDPSDPSPTPDDLILSPDRLAFASQAEESRCGFIPGYSILGSLGRGGMGVVYQAIQERLQRVVALKVLTPANHHDRDYVVRFEREAMAVARLNHPNIVTAYDYGEAEGRFYLAIEYVEGLDGAEVVEQQGRIGQDDAVAMARDAVLGLSHALSHGIIHRDIKPANLMLTAEAHRDASGGALSGRLKVTDLGLAQIREHAQDRRDGQLDAGKIVGTPCYMAPEQSRGESVDFRGDIYALGATLYHFVTGLSPFEGDDPYQVIRDKHEKALEHPQDLVPELSDDFCLVLDRMLARDREERHQSYEELLADLQGLLNGEGVITRHPPETSSLAPPARRRFKLFRSRRDTATPLPLRLHESAACEEREPFERLRRVLGFLVPMAIGFGLALLLF